MEPLDVGTYADLLADLAAEEAALDALVADLDASGWATPTPAIGWTVLDQIHHLAVADRTAMRCIVEGDASIFSATGGRHAPRAPDDVDGASVLEEWRTARRALHDAFASLDERARVPWVAGPMAARSLATARLMECWAHGLDCFAALGVAPVDTLRLRHVARLAWRALPHAFAVASRTPPAHPHAIAIVLDAPDGSIWALGDLAAADRITGDAGEWCRLAVRRIDRASARTLRADGPLADAVLDVVQAYA
jgi:uncharacterized protein (TIGR03084 family)